MNLQEMIDNLICEKMNNATDSAIRPGGISAEEKEKEATRKLKIILGEKFNGKIDNVSDLKDILKIIKKNENAFKLILWGVESPAKLADKIEKLISKMSKEETQEIIDADDRQKFDDPKKREIFDFVSQIEEKFFNKEVGDIGNLFYPGMHDKESSSSNIGKRFKNIIPVMTIINKKTYYGIIRPAGNSGESGIITWQVNASNDFSNEKDKNVRLPISVPLMQKKEGDSNLGIQKTKIVQALLDSGKFDYDDDPQTMEKMSNVVLDIIKESGRTFKGKDVKKITKEEMKEYLKDTDVPQWVFKDINFWKSVQKCF